MLRKKNKDYESAKQKVAMKALEYVKDDMIVGVGTGSTTNYFIEQLATMKNRIEGTVASSIASEKKLKEYGIPVFDLNSVGQVSIYVDGADEVDDNGYLIKGGGGALTREKILATCAKQFICIVDQSKKVGRLGDHPLPIEVIPMARSYVARQLIKFPADPVYRENFITDNGNIILDAYNLQILQPLHIEELLNNITGVVCHGLFAHRKPDIILVDEN